MDHIFNKVAEIPQKLIEGFAQLTFLQITMFLTTKMIAAVAVRANLVILLLIFRKLHPVVHHGSPLLFSVLRPALCSRSKRNVLSLEYLFFVGLVRRSTVLPLGRNYCENVIARLQPSASMFSRGAGWRSRKKTMSPEVVRLFSKFPTFKSLSKLIAVRNVRRQMAIAPPDPSELFPTRTSKA